MFRQDNNEKNIYFLFSYIAVGMAVLSRFCSPQAESCFQVKRFRAVRKLELLPVTCKLGISLLHPPFSDSSFHVEASLSDQLQINFSLFGVLVRLGSW